MSIGGQPETVLRRKLTLRSAHPGELPEPPLSVGQQKPHFLEIGLFNHLGLTQLSLSLGRFLG
jgi:hypothetical protein